jgi:hypothetical protein
MRSAEARQLLVLALGAVSHTKTKLITVTPTFALGIRSDPRARACRARCADPFRQTRKRLSAPSGPRLSTLSSRDRLLPPRKLASPP